MAKYILLADALKSIIAAPDQTADEKKLLIARLQAIPAADARPVVRGRWIVSHDYDSYQLLQCDQCNSMMWNHEKEAPNFCYNCGADMRPEGRTEK